MIAATASANVIAVNIDIEKLKPELLVGKTITVEDVLDDLMNMNKFENLGVTVINRF